MRITYNEKINRLPGFYNKDAELEIVELQQVGTYDKCSLTALDRANHMNAQFLKIEEILKKQLKVEQFEEFGTPIQDCIRISGRVVNLTCDEGNLTPDTAGLLNVGDENSST